MRNKVILVSVQIKVRFDQKAKPLIVEEDQEIWLFQSQWKKGLSGYKKTIHDLAYRILCSKMLMSRLED